MLINRIKPETINWSSNNNYKESCVFHDRTKISPAFLARVSHVVSLRSLKISPIKRTSSLPYLILCV